MNAGQMMMQTPLNATLSVAIPASPAMGLLPAGDQSIGNFVGVLAGMTPQNTSRAGGGEAAIMVGQGGSAANELSLVPMQSDTRVGVVAALQVLIATVAQAEPSDAQSSEGKIEPAKVKDAEDVEMPQNVVLCASGALVATEQQINGKIPEQKQMVVSHGDAHDNQTVMGLAGVLKLAPAPGNALKQTAGEKAEVYPAGAAATTSDTEIASLPTEKTAALPQRSSIGEQSLAPPVELRERGAVKIEVNADMKVETKPEMKVEAKPEVKVEVEPMPDLGIDKAEVLAESAPVLPQGAVIPVQSTVSGVKSVPVSVEKAEGVVVKETQAVAQGSAVQRHALSKSETADIVSRSTRNDAGQFDSCAADSALLSSASDKGQAALRPAEFRFTRSAAVEAALVGSQHVYDRIPEKNVPGHDNGMRIAMDQPVVKDADGNFSGSDTSFTDSNFDEFIQQVPIISRPAVQNVPGVHQQFSVDSKITTPPQTLQPESPRPGSSEHVAGQVRDQLGRYEIKTGSEQITIRLSPEHLGDIKVNFRLEDKSLRVEIVTENRFAKESLQVHSDSLKESLARQNINMDKFEVTTSSSSSGNQNQGNNAQGDWRELAKNRQSQQWLASGGYRTPATDEVQKAPVYFAGIENAGLDLHF